MFVTLCKNVSELGNMSVHIWWCSTLYNPDLSGGGGVVSVFGGGGMVLLVLSLLLGEGRQSSPRSLSSRSLASFTFDAT
jgi:hypothetical protein